MCCYLAGLWTLNLCEKEEFPCFLYLIQIFGFHKCDGSKCCFCTLGVTAKNTKIKHTFVISMNEHVKQPLSGEIHE